MQSSSFKEPLNQLSRESYLLKVKSRVCYYNFFLYKCSLTLFHHPCTLGNEESQPADDEQKNTSLGNKGFVVRVTLFHQHNFTTI